MNTHKDHLSRRDFLKVTHTTLWSVLITPFLPGNFGLVNPPVIFRHGKRDLPYVALTFDDCYSYPMLIRLEKLLENYPSAKVTFFPTGIGLINTSTKDPDLWGRLLDKGYEIGYHGYEHEYGSMLSSRQMLDDFGKWMKVYTRAISKNSDIKFARPPYGDTSRSFLDLCKERNLVVALWSVILSSGERLDRIKKGDIGLLHARNQDVENASVILPALQRECLQSITMTELYAHEVASEDSIPCKSPVDPNGLGRLLSR